MIYIPKKYVHLGIDETSLGLSKSSSIVVVSSTKNEELSKYLGFGSLKKAKNYLEDAKITNVLDFPSFEELRATGLDGFYWSRVNRGKFSSRQEIQHAYIAHIICSNGYDPKNTILHIDAFEANYEKSAYLITGILNKNNFKIPLNHVKIYGKGDICVPIINYADILAFQIGLKIYNTYKKYQKKNLDFPINPNEYKVNFNVNRQESLPNDYKKFLEDTLKEW